MGKAVDTTISAFWLLVFLVMLFFFPLQLLILFILVGGVATMSVVLAAVTELLEKDE